MENVMTDQVLLCGVRGPVYGVRVTDVETVRNKKYKFVGKVAGRRVRAYYSDAGNLFWTRN